VAIDRSNDEAAAVADRPYTWRVMVYDALDRKYVISRKLVDIKI